MPCKWEPFFLIYYNWFFYISLSPHLVPYSVRKRYLYYWIPTKKNYFYWKIIWSVNRFRCSNFKKRKKNSLGMRHFGSYTFTTNTYQTISFIEKENSNSYFRYNNNDRFFSLFFSFTKWKMTWSNIDWAERIEYEKREIKKTVTFFLKRHTSLCICYDYEYKGS